jgi:cyclic beta-1,2-glucan synthetase
MHRATLESLFGLTQLAQTLTFNPCLPSHWKQAELRMVRDGRSMRFILIRATARDALAHAAQNDAQVLLPGQALQWPGLAAQTCFVIPLQPAQASTTPPTTPVDGLVR